MKPIFGGFVCAAGDWKAGACALITPVYLEIALFSGARSGTQVTGQVIGAIDTADTSIRALREEGDAQRTANGLTRYWISIHALREEGDPCTSRTASCSTYFYPRPP